MTWSRREFLSFSGAASLAALSGCEYAPSLAAYFPELQNPFAAGPDQGSFEAPQSEAVDEVSHVLARLSYGARPGDYARVKRLGVASYLEEQVQPEGIDDRFCESLTRRLESLSASVGTLFEYKDHFLLDELTRGKLLRALYSRRQLYERMVEFWTDHFNIDQSKGDCKWLKTADDRDVVRRHALGSFPEMLRASALSPAMLWYLDGRANRTIQPEDQPNENYARELLELHTLGVHGGYTQEDVMEVARCLTGWTVRSEQNLYKGRLEFHPEWHDDGPKQVLGHAIPAGQGRDDIETVLSISVRHPSTAKHIATKLCRCFIAEEAPADAVASTAAAFSTSGGDIRSTLRALFATPAFLSARQNKIKRPFHFVVSALRATGAETDGHGRLLEYLLRMGHAPYQYPTPDGYPEETAPWLGTLFWRWHFATALASNQLGGAQVNWRGLEEHFGGEEAVMAQLLGRRPGPQEWDAFERSGRLPGLVLASPAFQRY